MEKTGIKNLKLLIGLPIEMGNVADSIGHEDTINWKKWFKVIDLLDEVVDVIKIDWKELKAEVADLDVLEREDLKDYIAVRFNIEDKQLEATIEKSLDIISSIGTLIVEAIALFRTIKK